MSATSASPSGTDRASNDTATLHPTATATATATPADHVTAGEIVEFLRELAEFRTGTRRDDPIEWAALQARKAELFARIAADPTAATAPEGHLR